MDFEQLVEFGPTMMILQMAIGCVKELLWFMFDLLHRMLVVRYTIPVSSYKSNQRLIENLFSAIETHRSRLFSPFYMVSTADETADESTDGGDGAADEKIPGRKLEIDSGDFLIFYRGAAIWVETEIKDDAHHNYSLEGGGCRYTKGISFSCLRWSRSWVEQLIQENNQDEAENGAETTTLADLINDPYLVYDDPMMEKLEADAQKKDAHKNKSGYYILPSYYGKVDLGLRWVRFCSVDYIDLDHIILPDPVKNKLLTDYERFSKDETKLFYKIRGINPKRCYLLYGKPGGGKSSFVQAFASKHQLNIYEISATALESISVLRIKLSEIPKGSIILIEDIDVIFTSREHQASQMGELSADQKYLEMKDINEQRYQMSGFFNLLDGIVPVIRECVVFITTNYIDHLDPALKRPGRMDLMVEFPSMTPSCIEKMFLTYFPDQTEVATRVAEQLSGIELMPAYFSEYLRERMFDSADEVADDARARILEMIPPGVDEPKKKPVRKTVRKTPTKNAKKPVKTVEKKVEKKLDTTEPLEPSSSNSE